MWAGETYRSHNFKIMKVRVKHIDAIVDVSASKAEKWIRAGYAEAIDKIDKTEGAEPKKAVKKDKLTKTAKKK